MTGPLVGVHDLVTEALRRHAITPNGDLLLPAEVAAFIMIKALAEGDMIVLDVETANDALFLIKGKETDVEKALREAVKAFRPRPEWNALHPRRQWLDEATQASIDLGTYDEPGPSTRP